MLAAALAAGVTLSAQGAAPPVPTIRPGMTEAAVREAWGKPAGARTRGTFTYLFFTSRCVPACKGQDIVILERGEVVDAVVRGAGRRYDGISSSPPDRVPAATPADPNPTNTKPSSPR